MQSILNRAKLSPGSSGRPPAAIELSPEGVLAAALPAKRRGTSAGPVYAFVPLPEGALVPSIDAPNFRTPEAVAKAVRSALDQVSPRIHAVTLIVPDPLVRVFVLDFDAFPAKSAEAVSVVRFRLRKMVPFEVEEAGVSYQILSQTESEVKVLGAVIPGAILAEYEAAIRDAGYEPGAVLSSSLAALEAAGAVEGVLAANVSASSVTTAVTSGNHLLLYRTLDLPPEPWSRAAEIERSIAVAAAYFEDKLGAPPQKLHYAGVLTPTEFAESISNTDLAVVEWTARPNEGLLTPLPQTSVAGVYGALAGAS